MTLRLAASKANLLKACGLEFAQSATRPPPAVVDSPTPPPQRAAETKTQRPMNAKEDRCCQLPLFRCPYLPISPPKLHMLGAWQANFVGGIYDSSATCGPVHRRLSATSPSASAWVRRYRSESVAIG